MVEADFVQFYQVDIRDLFDPGKPRATPRWASNLVHQLPDESRVKRRLANSLFTPDQHIAMDISDLLKAVLYQTSVGASVWMSSSDYKKVMEGAPRPQERPVFEKEKPKFGKGKDLIGLMDRQINTALSGITVIDED
jgi:hypothetical protein